MTLDAAWAEAEDAIDPRLYAIQMSATFDNAVERRRYHVSILGPRRDVDIVRERPRLVATGTAYDAEAAVRKAIAAFVTVTMREPRK